MEFKNIETHKQNEWQKEMNENYEYSLLVLKKIYLQSILNQEKHTVKKEENCPIFCKNLSELLYVLDKCVSDGYLTRDWRNQLLDHENLHAISAEKNNILQGYYIYFGNDEFGRPEVLSVATLVSDDADDVALIESALAPHEYGHILSSADLDGAQEAFQRLDTSDPRREKIISLFLTYQKAKEKFLEKYDPAVSSS